jgi:hypothetical protein
MIYCLQYSLLSVLIVSFLLSIPFHTNQQSNVPALQNAISGLDLSKNNNRKYEILETQASSNVLPPQFDTNSLDPTLLPASEEFPQFDKSNERRAASGESEEVRSRNFLPPPNKFEPPRVLPSHNQQFRRTEEERLKNLGLPLNSPTQATRVTQTTRKSVRTFDPDKNFKAFNHFFPSKKATHKDYDFSQYFTRKNQVAPTAPSAARRQDFNTRFGNNQLPVGPPATQRPSAFSKFTQQSTTTTTRRTTASTVRAPVTQKPFTTTTTATTRKAPTVTRSPAYFSSQTTPSPKNRPQSAFNQIQRSSIIAPSTDLQPPINVLKVYDDATTKGPPIYYEWKVPDGELLPPRYDNETDTLLNSLKRSITEEGNFGAAKNDFQSSESRRTVGHGNKGSSSKIQYKDLQRHYAIPQVEFPLESSGREGYEKDDAVNSFQVKIPYRSDRRDRYYYLEHGHCNPECHPYFFKPGRCEPCIKLKK